MTVNSDSDLTVVVTDQLQLLPKLQPAPVRAAPTEVVQVRQPGPTLAEAGRGTGSPSRGREVEGPENSRGR